MSDAWNFIDGGRRPARSGRTLDNQNPATAARIGSIAASQAEDVADAVEAAASAAAGWAAWPVAERAAVLERAAARLEARAAEVAAVESADSGKPVGLAGRMDIPRAVSNLRFFAGAARHDETGFHTMAGGFNYTLRRPLGVVGLITPWNLPLYLLTWKVAPALVMGNTAVAKPSELTPRTAGMLAEILAESGLPAGVFNVVHGLGPEAGAPLVAHPAVKALSFTGGTATGRAVAAAAAPALKKLSLELGGKNPTIIFADADLPAAIATAARAAFTNQGQICLCGSRILVERSVFAAVRDGLVAAAEALRPGDPADPSTAFGSLISHAHREKVEGYVALARTEGGRVCAGGSRPALPAPWSEGAFFSPTVIDGLAPTCRTATEEIFGPVVTVHPFDTEAEALEMANGVRYGLAASLFTRDLARAHRVAARIESGMVWVNDWLQRDLRVPFGGMKDSGVGREGGRWSMEFFSEARNVYVAAGA